MIDTELHILTIQKQSWYNICFVGYYFFGLVDFGISFLTGYYKAQAVLGLTEQLRISMAVNYWLSCLCLPNTVITRVWHQVRSVSHYYNASLPWL